MKISIRLIIGFGSLLFMMCFLTFLAISEVNLIDNTLSKMTDVNSKKQRYAINFRGSVHDRAIAIRDVVLSQNDNELKKQLSLIDKLDDFYQESAKSLKRDLSDNMTMTGEETSILKEINQIEVKTKIIMEKIINETQEKRMVQATTLLLDEASPAFVNWLNEINKFIDYQEALNKTATEETRSLTSGFQNRMIGLTLFALFLGTSLAYFILLRIKQSVGGEPREGEVIISRIAQGDLTGIIYTDYKNSMMDSVATMQNKLKDIVNSIAHSSTELFQRAETVTKSSESSLQLADQQNQYSASVVSALEDMSDSISSVANIVKQTEDNSRTTVELSLTGRESVQKVASEIEEISKTVSQTVNQVNLLEQTTNEIGNIVNVIRSISDQTNLLALNAAIEAARAGEAGRGFAVVADEVRQLAKRTGEATGEIENMITQVQVNTKASVEAMETTVPQVERGLVLTKEASKLLDDIQLQANSSMEKVLEVVKDTTNQVSTIENIKSSVSELDNISKNTSDAFQESVEQAKHLERLSAKLRSDIDYFSI